MLAGDAAAYTVSASTKFGKGSQSPKPEQPWQPVSTAAAESRWLIQGRHAMDSKTLAVTTLAAEGKLQWVAWCHDGEHAVLLLSFDRPFGEPQQQLRTCHVASGTLVASLACFPIPTMGHGDDTYVSLEAKAALLPETLQIVSICRLPGLNKIAQITAPEQAAESASLLCMGWADHGRLIVALWQATDSEIVVTVHSGSDGLLLHMLQYIASPYHASQFSNPHDARMFRAFAANHHEAAAAIAWRKDSFTIGVALIDLTSGTQKLLERPWDDDTYDWNVKLDMSLGWSPRGQYLMVAAVLGALDPDTAYHDWAIFANPSGELRQGPNAYHSSQQPPVWSQQHPFCQVCDDHGQDVYALDVSTKPAKQLSYFVRESPLTRQFPCFNVDFHTERCLFVPGTRDAITFEEDYGPKSAVCHWVFKPDLGRAEPHDVPGFSPELAGSFTAQCVAWQPTVKSAAIYALAEQKANAAIHLIDARRHCRLTTWTSRKLAHIFQEPINLDHASLAWSRDGKQLAINTHSGTAILSFSCGAGEARA